MQQQVLAKQALAKGYASVEDFAAELLGIYAAGPAYAGDPASLQRSAASLERSHEQSVNGESRDLHQSLQ